MVPSYREAAYALYGSWRLALLDRQGTNCFLDPPDAVIRSFFAAVLVAPPYFILLLLHLSELRLQADFLSVLLIELLVYAISWLVFPVAAIALAEPMGFRPTLWRFLVAYNWTKVLQTLFYLPLALLAASNALPDDLGGAGSAVGAVLVLIYSWYVTKVPAAVSGPAAALLVGIDLVLSVLLTGFADGRIA